MATSSRQLNKYFSLGSRLDWAILLIVAGLGLMHLPVVFGGDQAFFTLGALEMDRGERLYQDFWDLKQPGIFYFYYLGGKLFGFTNIGIHSLELLILLAFSRALQICLQGEFQHRSIASLSPLLTIGFYYCITGTWHLTQVESLVGVPIFIATWACLKGIQHWHKTAMLNANQLIRRSQFFNLWFWAAGAAGGIALLFKFVLAIILAAIWATLLLWGVANAPSKRWFTALKSMVQAALCLSLGAAFSLALGLIPIVQTGAGQVAWETFIVLPPRIVSEIPQAELIQLLNGLAWFRSRFFPLLLLASWGLFKNLPRGRNPIVLALLSWCLSGFAVVLLQKQAWWNYYYLLLLVPLGLLAVFGLDEMGWFWNQWHSQKKSRHWSRPLVCLSLVALFCIPLQLLARKSLWLSQEIRGVSPNNVVGHLYSANDEYQVAQATANLMPRDAPTVEEGPPGKSCASAEGFNTAEQIYVIGNPLIYLFAERRQATALNGWALEYFLPEQWEALIVQLEQTQPRYVFVTPWDSELMEARSPQTLAFIEAHYTVVNNHHRGKWYSLSSQASGRHSPKASPSLPPC